MSATRPDAAPSVIYFHIGVRPLRCSFYYSGQCEGLNEWDEHQVRTPRFLFINHSHISRQPGGPAPAQNHYTMGRPLHNPPIARAAWPTLLARPGHLFLALIITILSALPAAATVPNLSDITYPSGEVYYPLHHICNIRYILQGDIIKGIDPSTAKDYSITSDNESVINVGNDNSEPYLESNRIGNANVTFTHKDAPEVTFTVAISVRNGFSFGALSNPLYVGVSKTINIDSDIPVKTGSFWIKDHPELAKVSQTDNTVTVEAVAEGSFYLELAYDNCLIPTFGAQFNVAKKPSKEDIHVTQKSLIYPTQTNSNYLSSLIRNGVVTGIDENEYRNYTITSSDKNIVRIEDNTRFCTVAPGTATLTFTNKDFDNVSFDIDITVKESVNEILDRELQSVYLGDTVVINIKNEIPSELFSFEKGSWSADKDVDFSIELNGDLLTIIPLHEGWAPLDIIYTPYECRFSHGFTIAKKPDPYEINVRKESIMIPIWNYVTLDDLIADGVVEGIPSEELQYFHVSSADSGLSIEGNQRFRPVKEGSFTISFTHDVDPTKQFSIQVKVVQSTLGYVTDNIGTIYVGESKSVTIPDSYIPLRDFESITLGSGNSEIVSASIDNESNSITFTGLAPGEETITFKYKYGDSYNYLTVVKKPSKEDIIVHEKSITIPTSVSIYLSKLIESGIVSGVSGPDNDWIITSSNPDFYIYPTEYNSNHFSAYITGTSTITYTHKDFKEVSFSIEVTSKMSPSIYIGRNLGSIYLNESKSITIPDDCISLDEYSEIVKANYTYEGFPDSDFEVKRDGNKLTFTGLGEGQRGLRFNHKVYGWTSTTINIEKKPDVADIQTPGSGLVMPIGYSINLWNLIRHGFVTGLNSNQYNDYILTSSDENILSPSSDNTAASSRSTGEATLTFINKDFEDVKFDFVVNVKKGIDESVMAQLPNNTVLFVDVPRIINVDSEIPLSDYEITLIDNNGNKLDNLDISIDGNNIVLTGIKKTLTSARVYFMYKPLPIGFTRSVRIVEANPVTPEVDADGNGQSETWLDTPVKITIPAEIADKIEDGHTVVWKSDNEGVATVNENGIVNPLKPGKTVITASVEDGTSRAAATLMSIDFWVTDVEINCPTTFEVGDTYKATFKVIPEDYPNEIKNIDWWPYYRNIVDIDNEGNLVAVGPGTTDIYFSCSVGYKVISVTVTGGSVTEINLDTEKISGVEGTTYHLQADVDDLTWSSSDESVAVVDQNGIVTLVGAGRAIITATAPNGVKATCEVVVEAASGINGVEADTEAAFAPVYDLTGRLVARTPEQMAALRAGIYIQAGRKIYISK